MEFFGLNIGLVYPDQQKVFDWVNHDLFPDLGSLWIWVPLHLQHPVSVHCFPPICFYTLAIEQLLNAWQWHLTSLNLPLSTVPAAGPSVKVTANAKDMIAFVSNEGDIQSLTVNGLTPMPQLN